MDQHAWLAAWHTLLFRSRQRRLVHTLSLRCLVVVPVLLAVATAVVLFVHSDVNVAMLFSQCHARARLPFLSRIPLLGAPACFLVSFFGEALAESRRALAVMSVVLSYVAGLLTVSTVEAARICNGPSVLIAYPTGPWLVFDLLGGAMVWQLLILPAFFRRSKQIIEARVASGHDDGGDDSGSIAAATNATNPDTGSAMRHLAVVSETVAIPVAIALGYVVPSLIMLVASTPAAIVVWLFFPVYVSVIRQGVRWAVHQFADTHPSDRRSVHLETHRPSLLSVYALPIVCSALSHGFVLWSLLTQADDRKEMTRSTLRIIEIDFFFIVLTVLYWILVEAGLQVVAVVVGASVVLGPGAGLCIGWIVRERQLGFVFDNAPEPSPPGAVDAGHDAEANGPHEETPLLR